MNVAGIGEEYERSLWGVDGWRRGCENPVGACSEKESAREDEFWPGKKSRAFVKDSFLIGRLKMTVSRTRE